MTLKNLKDGDRVWLPKWLADYAKFHALNDSDKNIEVTEERVLAYLRSLRDTNVPAWRRLQAANAIDLYQNIVLRSASVDFVPIRKKLREIAAREKLLGDMIPTTGQQNLVPGEGNEGRCFCSFTEGD